MQKANVNGVSYVWRGCKWEQDLDLLYADLFELVLDSARRYLLSVSLKRDLHRLRLVQADWLEDLIVNYADELDEIETETPKGLPGPITWVDEKGESFLFNPSNALSELLLLARAGGLPPRHAEAAEKFCLLYGKKLDAILTVIQTA